jgi:hypothetical protein
MVDAIRHFSTTAATRTTHTPTFPLSGNKIGRGDEGGICSDDMIKGLDEMKDDPIITKSEP